MDYRWTHLGHFKLLTELRDYELTCASRSAFVSSSLIIRLMRSQCPDFGTTALNSSTSSLSKSRLDPSISLSKRKNDRINLNFEKTEGIRADIWLTFQRTLRTSQQVKGFLRYTSPFKKRNKLFCRETFQIHLYRLEANFVLQLAFWRRKPRQDF